MIFNGKFVAFNSLTANRAVMSNGSGHLITANGLTSQYLRGDGSLANFPSTGGGGNSVSYYFNGGTLEANIGGDDYYQMSKIAVIGTGVDFPLVGDGLVCSFLTDIGDPNLLAINGGNWNFEIFTTLSNNASGTPAIYVELYKYDGATLTLIATSIPAPILTTVTTALFFSLAIPTTSLLATDRLAVKIYSQNIGTRTITINTQDSHLCEIVTNFTSGLISLNGLVAQNQFFATGATGTDFTIDSTSDLHTFNIPDASVTARGLLTSSDWLDFSSKQNSIVGAADTVTTLNLTQDRAVISNATGKIAVSVTTLAELAFLSGTTASVQGQLNAKLTKGVKTIFCIDNGDYATGQAAIDAASQGDTILFGAKSGGWGDIVIPSGKGISILGLQADDSKYVRTGSITFSPTSGTIGVNEVYISNLYITSATQAAVLFGGSVAARLRIYNCYIAPTSNQKAVSLTNTITTSPSVYSSVYLNSCVIDAGLSTSAVVESNTPYVRITHSTIDGGSMSLQLNAGTLESDNNVYSLDSLGEIINIAGGTLLCTRSSIVNATANGSGILVGAAGVIGNVSNAFSVATGTGYCLRGTGIHAYAYITFANSALLAYNVKVQNTLTSVPYTTAFTLAP